MQRSDFYYDLPVRLIAQYPPTQRGSSRLLHLTKGQAALHDLQFSNLPSLLRAGDLLVFNDTRVIPARLWGRKASGGKIEILLERLEDDYTVLAQVRASKSPKPGSALLLEDHTCVTVVERQDEFFRLRFPPGRPALEILNTIGHMPLPPYIQRNSEKVDAERYQTIFARRHGAVAAPTAGLHFSGELLAELSALGVNSAFVTLHVGAGTFQPLRVDDVRTHTMHAEWVEVTPATCAAVETARQHGGRVIAVGTTSVRALETAAASGRLQPYQGDTRLFITPGYPFRTVDGLITNFHLPESTLLMLVCAFAGYAPTMTAYRHAVAQEYRFFSYGDAMAVL